MRAFLFALALLPAAINAVLPGDPSEYFDILGTGKKEWRLAFRGTAHIRQSMYDAYKDGSGIPYTVEDGCKGVNWKEPCTNHYRNNDALNNWTRTQEVILGVVDEDTLLKILRFKAKGTTYLDWMTKDLLLEDCWEDLKDQPTNYFSIEGHGAIRRRFYINRNYGGCDADAGWLVVADQGSPNCPWERLETWPYIKYVAGQTYSNWNERTVRSAQALVVFVKYLPGDESEYYDLFNSGEKEWRLSFRGTAKVGQPVYPAYKDGSGINPNVEAACKGIEWSATCTSHWRNNDALNNWGGIDQVLLGLIHNGEMVKTAFFSGEGTTYMNWMEPEHYLRSCWEDLKSGPHNYFSIIGDDGRNRRFFINRNYGGCDNDAGWFVAVDDPPRTCPWQVSDYYPMFKFAAGPKYQNWNKGEVLEADALVVFLKYKSS